MIDRVEAIEPGQTQANESLLQDFRRVMFKRLRAIEDNDLVIIINI
jgi:flagellar basal body L-ring protein FlgH